MLAARRRRLLLALPTSGSTGAPRRVLRTTESWWASFDAYTALTGVASGARLWVPGPLAATMNLFAAVHAAVVGAQLVEHPADATHACLTPAQLDNRGGDLHDGAAVVVAGDALPPRLRDAALGRGLRVAHYYGASELSFVACARAEEPLRPFPGVAVEERAGELWVRSPYLCTGYAGTDGPLRRPLRRDAQGWATVGDLGRYDGNAVTVLGRPGHVVTGGATVSLAEVQAVLAAVATGDVAVCGLPHPSLGSVLAVALTEPADRRVLEQHARTQLPPTHRPRVWHVVDRLPVGAHGELDRAELVQQLGPAHA